MTKEWLVKKQKEQKERADLHKKNIDQIMSSLCFTENERKIVLDEIEDAISDGFMFFPLYGRLYDYAVKLYGDDRDKLDEFTERIIKMREATEGEINALKSLWVNFERFLDSDPVKFSGDIIITDPCYVTKADADDWEKCDYGYHMEELGITHYMSRDTLYGDWSCGVFNTDTKRKMGEFCADAGMVSVILLDDILKYHPKFDYHIKRKWTTAWIKNFEGTVQFVVHEEKFTYKDKEMTDYNLELVGHGFNRKTGKPINFTTRQTCL